MIYNEDCLKTLQRELKYDYVITSPPDFDEIGLDPRKDLDVVNYKKFMNARFRLVNPTNDVITLITRDRKIDGTVFNKAGLFESIMSECGWSLKSRKIWVRSYKANLYRFNYSFIQTFKRNKVSFKDLHLADAYYNEVMSLPDYKDNYPVELIKPFIEAYVLEGGTIMDPFIGSGSTALAAIELKMNYYGSEIVPKVFELAEIRIQNWKNIYST